MDLLTILQILDSSLRLATPLLRYDAQSAMRYERNNERALARGSDVS